VTWREPWREDAACLAVTDKEVFFPLTDREREEAKLVCQSCPVTSECLDWAMVTGQRYGIWGGRDVEDIWRERSHRRREPSCAAT
jgi:WhiB family redox-sensing transcriptional regulator